LVGKNLVNLALAPFERFYSTAKVIYLWRMRHHYRRFNEGPLLILQMGKVGSSSILAGLKTRIVDRPVYHTHFLSRERTAETERMRKKYFRTELHQFVTREWRSQFLLHTFETHKDNRVWKLVTLTREPIGRNISAFFQHLRVTPGESDGEFEISSDHYKIDSMIVSVDDTSTLNELFFDRTRHDSPLRFFDREIRDIFGIDVIGSGFPIEKGYEIYKANRVELLVLRLEDLAECAGAAFEEFLGIPDFQVPGQNIATDKVYAPLYEAFKRDVDIDSAYAERLLDSDYMRTFYSADEIRDAKRKWLKQ